MKKSLTVVCSVMLLAMLAVLADAGSKKAPGIALYNMNDQLVKLSELTKSNNVIVAFWASYCVPCKKEMPQLVQLEKKYSGSKGVKLLLINIDKEGKQAAQPVLDELGVEAECLLDSYQTCAKKYISGLKIPAVFLVNTSGEIVYEAVGESSENISNLEKAIKKLN